MYFLYAVQIKGLLTVWKWHLEKKNLEGLIRKQSSAHTLQFNPLKHICKNPFSL